MCLGSKTEKVVFSIDGNLFENSEEKTILGVTIDNKFTFYNHIKGLCKEASLFLPSLIPY